MQFRFLQFTDIYGILIYPFFGMFVN